MGGGSPEESMMKMEPTQSSETSAFNIQTPGKYPEDYFSFLLICCDFSVQDAVEQIHHLLS
jgi:hypothetical protein